MFRADLAGTELERFSERQLEDLLETGRHREVPARRSGSLAHDLSDPFACRLEAHPERSQGLGGQAVSLAQQAQQEVLRARVGMVEQPGFLLSQEEHLAGWISEPFEHSQCPLAVLAAPRQGRPGNDGLSKG